MSPREYYVYIMTNHSGTLYTGVTNDLIRRVDEHKRGKGSSFTGKYRINRLLFYESTNNVHVAIAREKEIKTWRREKKVELIKRSNPTWRDISKDW